MVIAGPVLEGLGDTVVSRIATLVGAWWIAAHGSEHHAAHGRLGRVAEGERALSSTLPSTLIGRIPNANVLQPTCFEANGGGLEGLSISSLSLSHRSSCGAVVHGTKITRIRGAFGVSPAAFQYMSRWQRDPVGAHTGDIAGGERGRCGTGEWALQTVSLEHAVAMIPDGASLMIGGFMGVGTPERLVDELVRQGKRELTVIANDTAMPGSGHRQAGDGASWCARRSPATSASTPRPSSR